eukprot:6729857-Pyramimonas_sp.AAC.1
MGVRVGKNGANVKRRPLQPLHRRTRQGQKNGAGAGGFCPDARRGRAPRHHHVQRPDQRVREGRA